MIPRSITQTSPQRYSTMSFLLLIQVRKILMTSLRRQTGRQLPACYPLSYPIILAVGFSIGRCVDAYSQHHPENTLRNKSENRLSRKPIDMEVYLTRIHISDLHREVKVDSPLGFFVDIGVPYSVVGRKEINRLLSTCVKHRREIMKSINRFRFEDFVSNRWDISIYLYLHLGEQLLTMCSSIQSQLIYMNFQVWMCSIAISLWQTPISSYGSQEAKQI